VLKEEQVEKRNEELRKELKEKREEQKEVLKRKLKELEKLEELIKRYEDPPLSPKCCRLVPTEQIVGVKQSNSNVY